MKYFDRMGILAGLIVAFAVVVMIYAGSRGFADFDWALTTYAAGSIFAAFAVAYRYAVWSQRPPTKMYLKRGLRSFIRPLPNPRNPARLGKLLLDNFLLQKFITKRSAERWIMHACLSWGGMLAFAVTFPLVFGWIHFETLPNDAETYRVIVAGFTVEQFSVHGVRAFVHFNVLNLSALLMLVGLALSIKLRMSDKGEMATQTFADDVLPVLLLFAVTITGLMLTVSANFLAGDGFQFIGMAHAASVIGLLLYLPFGKLFHIIQRPLSLGVAFYKKEGQAGAQATCLRCNQAYASQMHIDDLKTVLDDLGFNFRFATPAGVGGPSDGLSKRPRSGVPPVGRTVGPTLTDYVHYQDICPPCRRRLLALTQGKALGR